MYFIIAGDAYVEKDAVKHLLEPGKIYLIPAGARFNYNCASEIRKFYLHFQLEILPGVDMFHGLQEYLWMPYQPELLEQILRCAKSGDLTNLLQLKAIFTEIAGKFLQKAMAEHEVQKNYSGFYQQKELLEYIAGHLDAELRVNTLVEALGVPYHMLTRSFKRDTGVGLKEYMEEQLLHRVKQLLIHSSMSISEIADKLHFCDAYYLSRFFRKYEQESPREYRRKRQDATSKKLLN